MMCCLVRLLLFILLFILVDSNQEKQASTPYQQQSCGCHGRDGRDGRDGLSGIDGVKGDKGNHGRDGKKGEPGICDIKELTAIKSKLQDLTREVERLNNQPKEAPCDQGRQSSGGAAEIPNNSVEASWVHGVQVSADTDLAGDDFHEQSINAHENRRIQQDGLFVPLSPNLFTLKKHNHRCLSVEIRDITCIAEYECKRGLRFFEKFQEIPTKGATAAKLFSIGDELFLVFANYYDDNLGKKAKSVVYKMENERFVLIQTLSTHGPYGIEHFTIDGVHYMAIANYNDGSYKQNSVIYKWSTDKFEEFQVISTNGASGFKFFTIEGDHYLAVAEYYDDSTYSIDSFVYKWKQERFEKYQNIPTDGARACDSTVIANETFLVYANYYHPQKKYNTESNVYKWSGGHFLKFQSVPTQGAYSAKFFRVNGHVFLAFVNYYTGSKYNTNSPIYKWDGVKFTLFQEILTQGAMEMHPFGINDEMFFAVANHYGDSGGNSVRSIVYKASGAQFTLYQDLQTFGAHGVHAIVHKGERYLVFANYYKSNYNIESFVYKFI